MKDLSFLNSIVIKQFQNYGQWRIFFIRRTIKLHLMVCIAYTQESDLIVERDGAGLLHDRYDLVLTGAERCNQIVKSN